MRSCCILLLLSYMFFFRPKKKSYMFFLRCDTYFKNPFGTNSIRHIVQESRRDELYKT